MIFNEDMVGWQERVITDLAIFFVREAGGMPRPNK